MNKVKFALIHHPASISRSELEAAAEGMREFARFGVSCEEIGAGGSVAHVKRGALLKEAAAAGELSVHKFALAHIPLAEFGRDLLADMLRGFPSDFIRNRARPVDSMGIALTGGILFERRNDNENFRSDEEKLKARRIGVSFGGVGGIVSLSRLRELCYRTILPEAVRLAVMHEAGHVLGKKGHCAEEGCLMQENRDTPDFIRRFVENKARFCIFCLRTIESGVRALEKGEPEGPGSGPDGYF
ncbi:MAG TPA: hypothetical protein VLD37_00625 [Candidatus Bilamarchaeum sp.]|nr:hypothetical protein [Candidatus Bilamarchaeum sp.]